MNSFILRIAFLLAEFPFEFRALEVALEAICASLDAQTRELEISAYPALDALTSKVNACYLSFKFIHHLLNLLMSVLPFSMKLIIMTFRSAAAIWIECVN